jgi:Tol biopolymer transport system component
VTSWSLDGRFLMCSKGENANDLTILPLFGDREPIPFLQTEFNKVHGQFSPDGELVAYSSNESGPFEVYVRPFPESGIEGLWRVSADGGRNPMWRARAEESCFTGMTGKSWR